METLLPPLRLFGVPTLALAAGGEHVFAADRPHQLLALLGCRGDWVARAELAEWLWNERSGEAALSNLRKVLLLAQRLAIAQGAPPVEARPGLLRWAPDSDLRAFERACDEARAADALAAWRTPLLQSLDGGLSQAALEWLDFERARLLARWRKQAVARLAQLHDAPDAAAELAEQLLHADPCDEAALTALVHARLSQGRAALALRELLEHGERVRTQFGVEPSAGLRELATAARQATGVPAGALRSMPPAPPADFVGRRLELMQLRDWLQQERRRAVSITGPGGIGKTRLAQALLATWAADAAVPAVWVPLTDLREAAALPLRLAAALKLPATGAADAWTPVFAYLATAPALLVLDNGEQVEGLQSALVRLLSACPGLQLLNVSRTRLLIEGEWLLPLDGLPLPDADECDLELLRRNDAVALFERRAPAVAPAFEFAAQAADVVRFVHAVEGLPLAVELGAALVRLLPVAQIEAEIAGAAATMPALDASFELSWKGLSVTEKQALHALARLPADVDRHWAEQLARAPLPVLASLVDKSLLRADGHGRFGLHPLLRHWAARRGANVAADAALDERHSAFVALTLDQLGRNGTAAPQQLVGTLRTEWSHVTAAWQRAVAAAQGGFVMRTTPVLHRFFELHGGWDEGLAMLAAALPAFDAGGPGDTGRARMHLLRALAALQMRSSRHAEAETHARQALRLALRLGEGTVAAACLTTLGLSVLSRGLYAQAQPILQQAVRRSRALGDPARTDVALGNLAVTELALGRFDAALAIFSELIPRSRQRGDHSALIVYLGNAGEAHRGRGDWAAALAAHSDALALCDQHGVRSRRVTKLLNIAAVHHAEGRHAIAASGLDDAVAEARSVGDPSNEASSLLARAALRIDTGEREAAHADLEAALAQALAIDSADLQLRCVAVYGEWSYAAGADPQALQWTVWATAQPALYAGERAAVQHRLARRGVDTSLLGTRAQPSELTAATSPRDVALLIKRMLTAAGAPPAPSAA